MARPLSSSDGPGGSVTVRCVQQPAAASDGCGPVKLKTCRARPNASREIFFWRPRRCPFSALGGWKGQHPRLLEAYLYIKHPASPRCIMVYTELLVKDISFTDHSSACLYSFFLLLLSPRQVSRLCR